MPLNGNELKRRLLLLPPPPPPPPLNVHPPPPRAHLPRCPSHIPVLLSTVSTSSVRPFDAPAHFTRSKMPCLRHFSKFHASTELYKTLAVLVVLSDSIRSTQLSSLLGFTNVSVLRSLSVELLAFLT